MQIFISAVLVLLQLASGAGTERQGCGPHRNNKKGAKISGGTYGYRRMTIWLNDTLGITVNSKRVRRVMKKAGFQSKIRRGKKFKVMDGTTYKYDNILNRDFYADRPNEKFVTDITYIKDRQRHGILTSLLQFWVVYGCINFASAIY
ncbi:MAG: IS3 family transposase [Synergistaceae bacterium]|nr:IS3 family transposase [Synergistaceae bacterium]